MVVNTALIILGGQGLPDSIHRLGFEPVPGSVHRIPNGSFRLKFSPEVLVGYQNFRPPTCSIARTTEVRVRCKL